MVCGLPSKDALFLVFHRNIGLKTSTYEFTDRIHQNKAKRKKKGREFVAFEEYQRVCVVDIAGSAILTVFLPGFSRSSCLLSSRILQNNLLDLYFVQMRRYNLSWSFFAKSATKSLPHFSFFKKIVALR